MIDRAKRAAQFERFDARKREVAAEDRHDHFGGQLVRVIARRLWRFGYAETAEAESVGFDRCVVGLGLLGLAGLLGSNTRSLLDELAGGERRSW